LDGASAGDDLACAGFSLLVEPLGELRFHFCEAG
jgi:hypothetical protein